MPRLRTFLLCPLVLFAGTIAFAQGSATSSLRVASPNDQVALILSTGAQTEPSTRPDAHPVDTLHYAVEFHGKRLFDESALGLKLEGQAALGPGMRQVDA